MIATEDNYELRNFLIRMYKNKDFKLKKLKEVQKILISVYDEEKFTYIEKFFNLKISWDDKIEIAKLVVEAPIKRTRTIYVNYLRDEMDAGTIKLLFKCKDKEKLKLVLSFANTNVDYDYIKLLVETPKDKSKIINFMLEDNRYTPILYSNVASKKNKILKNILYYIQNAENKECALAMKEVADNFSLENALSIIEYQAEVKDKDFAIVIGELSHILNIISLKNLIATYEENNSFVNSNNVEAVISMKDMIKKTPKSCETILKILSYEKDFYLFKELYEEDRVAAIDGLKELNKILYDDSYEVEENKCYVPYIKKEGK